MRLSNLLSLAATCVGLLATTALAQWHDEDDSIFARGIDSIEDEFGLYERDAEALDIGFYEKRWADLEMPRREVEEVKLIRRAATAHPCAYCGHRLIHKAGEARKNCGSCHHLNIFVSTGAGWRQAQMGP